MALGAAVLLTSLLSHKMIGLQAAIDFKTQCESLTTGIDGSFYGFHNCFVITDTTYDWTDQPARCNHFNNGRLVVFRITTMYDYINTVLVNLGLTTTYWIGGAQANKTDEPAGNWEWVDGSQRYALDVPDSWWEPGHPNNALNYEECLTLTTAGRFDDRKCANNYRHVCQYEHPTNRRSFKRVFKGKKGSNSTVIGEWSGLGGNTQSECSLKCAAEYFCFSYSIDRNNDKCYIHWDDAKFSHLPPEIDPDYELFVRV